MANAAELLLPDDDGEGGDSTIRPLLTEVVCEVRCFSSSSCYSVWSECDLIIYSEEQLVICVCDHLTIIYHLL